MSAILDAAVLWDALATKAGLDPDEYDDEVVTEPSDALAIPANDFRQELQRRSLSAEKLLLQLLRAVAPYARMTGDILAFFADAGVRRGGDRLRIRFNFDAADDFAFDL